MESVLENVLPTGKPKWLKVKLPIGQKYTELRGLVDKYKLNTICTSGSCPNMGECWGEGTATFMILGNICTRSCGFCGVKTGRPETVDWDEPEKVARSIKIMNIKQRNTTLIIEPNDINDKLNKLYKQQQQIQEQILELKNMANKQIILNKKPVNLRQFSYYFHNTFSF